MMTAVSKGEQQTLRVFISSPSDVRPERLIAERVVRRLDRELASQVRLKAVLWEREPLLASHHFQEKVTVPHETDIVVVILWSRLGSLLPGDKFRGALSLKRVTGTEWEFEDALKSYRECSRPDILMYRKIAEVTGILSDRDAIRLRLEQMDLVEAFVQRWFVSEKDQLPSAASFSFEDGVDFEEMLETHLRELIRRRLKTSERETAPRANYFDNPFRGLLSFEPEHAAVFFGRTRARHDLRELLTRRAERGVAFVIVFGASGSGKSSLAKAGLLPDLMLPGMVGHVALMRYAILRPSDRGGALLEALAAAMITADEALPELGASPLGETIQTLVIQLRESAGRTVQSISHALNAAARSAGLRNAGEARLLLVVDQLEELFTQDNVSAAERTAFVGALETLAKSGLVWVVATMRSDFFDRLETMPALAALSDGEARFLLLPPDAAEMGQIIRQPTWEAGLRFEADPIRGLGLDEIIRQAAASERGALPLLSFLLDQLWRQRSISGALTFAAYEELGGLEGAIGRRAEEVFLGEPDEVRGELVSMLRALVTAKDGKVTSRSVSLAMFAPGSPRRRLIDAFLDPRARLLVADADASGTQLRLAHEALLTHWPRARDQVAEDTRDLELRGRLEQQAEAWRSAPRRHKLSRVLAPGLPLAEAVALCARWGTELPADVTEFVIASRRAVRRKRSRLIATMVAAVAALPVAAALIWMALVWRGVRSVEAEMEFVQIPAGCFTMGSPEIEVGRDPDEYLVPEVCPRPFALAKFEVTRELWSLVMLHNSDPSYFKGNERLPVESISWNEAKLFTQLMSFFGQRRYRLPSEAEWEYAARAGTATARYWGERVEDGCAYENMADLSLKKKNPDAVVANCHDGHSGTAPVGSFKPNPFGLHDMLGNVAEWTEDCYVSDRRNGPKDGSAIQQDCTSHVIRGGRWDGSPRYARAARRSGGGPGYRGNEIGLRLARDPD